MGETVRAEAITCRVCLKIATRIPESDRILYAITLNRRHLLSLWTGEELCKYAD